MIDLHLHTHYSDGDWSVAQLLVEAQKRGVTGVSITDHNGIWSQDELIAYAAAADFLSVPGIEISTRAERADVHILGYSRAFNAVVLDEALRESREGYERRIQQMVSQLQAAGFPNLSFADIVASRQQQRDPSYVTYDVATQLTGRYGLSVAEARQLTVKGGTGYVPYGDWALSPTEAIAHVHAAGGIAVWAHPGIVAHEVTEEYMWQLMEELVAAGVDGIEVRHPFHSAEQTERLSRYVTDHSLLVTAGSDWHGPGRYEDAAFGQYGITQAEWDALFARLPV